MAGSGLDGGWVSGTCWYDRHKQRRDKFLADHPEWAIVFVRSLDAHEASTGDTDTELVILTDRSLGTLMDRLEARYGDTEDSRDDTP